MRSADEVSVRPPWLVVAIGLAALLVVLIRTAWLSDDAYITLRTVDNLVNGYGMRWNIAERVQSFTHPAWMLTMSVFYLLTHEAYFTVIVLQLAISLMAAGLILRKAAASSATAGLAVAMLAGSKAFIEYSTSGLENPLTHLALVGFLLLWRGQQQGREHIAWLGCLAAVLLLCRVDLAVMLAPLLLAVLLPLNLRRVLSFAAGLAPFVIWELFSLVYYGQLVPNTALAKLPQGVAFTDLARQGVRYFSATFLFDPMTMVVLAATIVALFWRGGRTGRLIGGGVVLHLLAVVGIGGDFMTGRFITPAFVAAVSGFLLTVRLPLTSMGYTLLAGGVVVGAALNASGPLRTGAEFGPAGAVERYGVSDERRFYYPDLGLLRVMSGAGAPERHPNAVYAQAIKAEPEPRIFSSVGLVGYYAGAAKHIIDRNALTDPLLARLPAQPGWRIGHFLRNVPDGYVESCATGTNLVQDPRIHALFDDVMTVTRGPLWSWERWRAIGRLSKGSPKEVW